MVTHVPEGSPWIPDDEWVDRKVQGRAAEQRAVSRARRVLDGQRRALSIRRPWANLIIAGHKHVENRTWGTDHRGEFVVHAGKAWEPAGAKLAAEVGVAGFADSASCPSGYLGIVRLVDVHPADGSCCSPWGEQGPDIVHWVVAHPRPFPEPVPGRGRLGLYWVLAETISEA